MDETERDEQERFIRAFVQAYMPWWDKWWADDFSWGGLAAKPWLGWVIAPSGEVMKREDTRLERYAPLPDGYRQANLQDYWRDQEAFLINEPGSDRRWTFFHCPWIFKDGSLNPILSGYVDGSINQESVAIAPYVRAYMDRLEASFAASDDHYYGLDSLYRLRNRREEDYSSNGRNADGRVQFQGTTSLDFMGPAQRPIHICAYRSCSFGNFSEVEAFGPAADFSDTLTVYASFSGVAFKGEISFRNSYLTAYFSRADFGGTAYFDGCIFPRGDFFECRFRKDASFENTTFLSEADFTGTCFEGDVSFANARFLDAASFSEAGFMGHLNLLKTAFYSHADFSGIADGSSKPGFKQTIDFAKKADSERYGGTIESATPATALNYKSFSTVHADGAIFHYAADFSNRSILAPSSFERAEFRHAASFHGSQLHPGVNFFASKFADAFRFQPKHMAKVPEDLLRLRYTLENAFYFGTDQPEYPAWKAEFIQNRLETAHENYAASEYFNTLESCFRTLKQAMENRRDGAKEGEFFRLELLARRRVQGVPLWEVAASHAYELFSNYGNSVARPLIFLFLVFFPAFALIFFAIGHALGVHTSDASSTLHLPWHNLQIAVNDLMSACSFSWSNIFHPLSALSAEGYDSNSTSWLGQLLGAHGEGYALCVKMIATLQSILSIILAFLFSLSVRRRFQIS